MQDDRHLKSIFFRFVRVGDIEIHYVGARALFCNYIPKSHHLIIALHAWSAPARCWAEA